MHKFEFFGSFLYWVKVIHAGDILLVEMPLCNLRLNFTFSVALDKFLVNFGLVV